MDIYIIIYNIYNNSRVTQERSIFGVFWLIQEM